MGEGRETQHEGGVRAHEDLLERIVSGAAGASREERAQGVVDAIAELLERNVAHAPRVLAELLEDDDARQCLVIRLDCPASQVSRLLGGAAVALLRGPSDPSRRAQTAEALLLICDLADPRL